MITISLWIAVGLAVFFALSYFEERSKRRKLEVDLSLANALTDHAYARTSRFAKRIMLARERGIEV